MTAQVPPEILNAANAAPGDDTKPPRRTKAPAARAKKATAAKHTARNPAAGLLAAVKFVSAAQHKAGNLLQTHCSLSHHWAAATNEVLTAGHPIEEDLTACPQTAPLIDALSQVENEVSIAAASEFYLSISSGLFRAMIPCAPESQVTIPAPDEPIAEIDDRLKVALEAVLKIPNEASPDAKFAAILLQAGSCVATNGAILVEYWHGIDLPPGLLLPKSFAQAVTKTAKKLVRFGFSQNSVTFWFEDRSFIKTQTYAGEYAHYAPLFERFSPDAFWPVPPLFFKAVSAVANFNDGGRVYFKNGQVVSDLESEETSQYQVGGLPEGMGFDSKLLGIISDKATSFCFDERHLAFFGENCRGLVAALEVQKPTLYRDNADDWANPGFAQERPTFGPDDEIPF